MGLFLRAARRTDARFSLTPENRLAVFRICRTLQGMPLGLELAASWLRLYGCGGVARELERDLKALETPLRDVPERHRSLRAVFEGSWRLLTQEERGVLMKLSVFRGGFAKEAAKEVADASPHTLLSLIDKSLVQRVAEDRFDLHEVVRQNARAELTEHSEKEKHVKDRHAEYYARFMIHRLQEEYGPDHKEIIDALERELANVRAAWPHILERRDLGQIDRVRKGLFRYHRYRGNSQESIAMLSRAVPVLSRQEEAREVLGGVLRLLASLHLGSGQLEQSRSFLEQRIKVLRHSDDPDAEAVSSAAFAFLALRLGDYSDAISYYNESLEIYRKTKNRVFEAIALGNLGHAFCLSGDYAQAEKCTLESVALDRDLDNLEGVGSDLVLLGDVYLATDRLEKAKRAYKDALDRGREIDFQRLIAQALTGLGQCTFELGDCMKAKGFFDEAQKVLVGASDFDTSIEVEYGLARVATALGRYNMAHRQLSHALTRTNTAGHTRAVLDGLLYFGELYCRSGRDDLGVAALTHVVDSPKASRRARASANGLLSKPKRSSPNREADERTSFGGSLALDDLVQRLLSSTPPQPPYS